MNKTWKPTAAGIIDIVAGALSLILLLLVIIGVVVFMAVGSASSIESMPVQIVPAVIFSLAIPMMAADVLAIIGGAYALRRKIWGLSLAGSIAAIFASWPLGIVAIVFTVTSKNEFEQ